MLGLRLFLRRLPLVFSSSESCTFAISRHSTEFRGSRISTRSFFTLNPSHSAIFSRRKKKFPTITYCNFNLNLIATLQNSIERRVEHAELNFRLNSVKVTKDHAFPFSSSSRSLFHRISTLAISRHSRISMRSLFTLNPSHSAIFPRRKSRNSKIS